MIKERIPEWRKLFVMGLLLLPTLFLKGQDFRPSDWPREILIMADTGADVTYLSEKEKEVLLLTNLVRLEGERFLELYLDDFLTFWDMDPGSLYIKSLRKDLKKTGVLPVFFPDRDLSRLAKEHAVKSGKWGRTGHQGFKRRYDPLMGDFSMVGENCEYGSESSVSMVLNLLIDEGIPDLGHRKNILHSRFTHLGIGIAPHTEYTINMVMSFGAKKNKRGF